MGGSSGVLKLLSETLEDLEAFLLNKLLRISSICSFPLLQSQKMVIVPLLLGRGKPLKFIFQGDVYLWILIHS